MTKARIGGSGKLPKNIKAAGRTGIAVLFRLEAIPLEGFWGKGFFAVD
jgi:hypothetical protein